MTAIRTTYLTRWLVRADLPQIADIDAASFGPLGIDSITELLHVRNMVGTVITPRYNDGDIRGFMLHEFNRSYLSLIHLAVSPLHLREGVGTAALQKLTDKLDLQRRRKIHASVDERHLPMQQFLRVRHFIATHITPGTFSDSYEFTYVLPSADCEDGPSWRWQPQNRIKERFA